MWSLSFASKIKEIVDRPKQIFSEGAASSAIILSIADDTIPDEEFQSEHERLLNRWRYRLPNKEVLYYYRLSQQHYEDRLLLPNVGRSHSLWPGTPPLLSGSHKAYQVKK